MRYAAEKDCESCPYRGYFVHPPHSRRPAAAASTVAGSDLSASSSLQPPLRFLQRNYYSHSPYHSSLRSWSDAPSAPAASPASPDVRRLVVFLPPSNPENLPGVLGRLPFSRLPSSLERIGNHLGMAAANDLISHFKEILSSATKTPTRSLMENKFLEVVRRRSFFRFFLGHCK